MEPVTQRQHALQTASQAQQQGARPELITAALLHDIGHMLQEHHLPRDVMTNLDDGHEQIGYEFLKRHFGDAVADPVRLHVLAKRYLCTTTPDYIQKLSSTSRQSYHDQGGPMLAVEIEAFQAEPHFHDAVRLRTWDDAAKDPTWKTPPVEAFVRSLEQCIASGS